MIPNRKIFENANKVAFLIQQYPDQKLTEIISLLAGPGVDMPMPAIEINTALWAATQVGWVTEPDPETNIVTCIKTDEDWTFGETLDTLQDMLLYAFKCLALKQNDLEENYLSEWTRGYSGYDVIIAMKRLLNSGELFEYTLKAVDFIGEGKKNSSSIYTFYTLFENQNEQWGSKQFKKPPTKPKK